jgi:hypothetical protein
MRKFGQMMLVAGACVVLASRMAYADVYTNMTSELSGHVTEATSVVSTLALAGLGIFALIWGIRKFKSAVRAGA